MDFFDCVGILRVKMSPSNFSTVRKFVFFMENNLNANGRAPIVYQTPYVFLQCEVQSREYLKLDGISEVCLSFLDSFVFWCFSFRFASGKSPPIRIRAEV